MRYDENTKALKIECREFVSIARRRISAALPYDDAEPECAFVPQKTLKLLTEYGRIERLTHTFCALDFDFELLCRPDCVRDGEVHFIRMAEMISGKLPSAVKAQTEGESYTAAYILSLKEGHEAVRIRMTYIDSRTGLMTEDTELIPKEKLEKFFGRCVKALSEYAKPEIERVTKRLPTMRSLKFPYGKMRDGQAALVKATYRTIAKGTRLFASAPTGTGKTVATLYPAVRALGDNRCDKVFYLTPKTTTAMAAKDCIELMSEQGADIRAIVLSSKDRSCQMGRVCKNGKKNCQNSRLNRLHEAVFELYEMRESVMTLDKLLPTAAKFTVCPYELELAYSELSDVVICDFNYLFEPTVYIKRFFEEGGNFAFLVDEAHNLADRAREMYSAELDISDIAAASDSLLLSENSELKATASVAAKEISDLIYPYLKEEIRESGSTRYGAYNSASLPGELFGSLESLMAIADKEINSSLGAKDARSDERLRYLRDYLIKLKRFDGAMSRFDESYEFFAFYENGNIRIKIFCLDTGGAISERLDKGGSAVFFSATLVPIEYYRATLGGERNSEMLEGRSPFDPSQLSVCVIDKISTRYAEREDTLLAVCRTIAATVSVKRGHYMVFSPSFEYSEALYKAFSAKYPKIKVIAQKKNMSAKEKSEFLAEFKKDAGSYLVAFCVTGGIYSEGVDLVGDSLIGAIVVGIGIPSVSYEREAMSAYYQDRFEAGKEYAYIYPGMNRVFQAAGRVIRHEDDRGVIVLIDDRFDDPIYKRSVPEFWSGMKYIPDAKTLKLVLEDFWRRADSEKA